MPGYRFVLALITCMLSLVTESAWAGSPQSLNTLAPGAFRTIEQDLQVNIVFVGIDTGSGPRNVDDGRFASIMPASYVPAALGPRFFGKDSRTGVAFTFHYNIVHTNLAFNNAFFTYLASIAVPSQRTRFQDFYNGQHSRSLNIGQSYLIDAMATEQWLSANAGPLLGVDTRQYTVFFINWFGRPDFKFHLYSKTDETDPDTHFNNGLLDYRKLMAWGGTKSAGPGAEHRIWFCDLSAGPDGWAAGYDLDDADVDGDGFPDYRIPPIWEYGNVSAYRPFDDLTEDLWLITRFVAINLLFTPSPGFPVTISAPRLPSKIQIDINAIELDPLGDAKPWVNADFIAARVTALQPYNSFSIEVRDTKFNRETERSYLCFFYAAGCYGTTPDSTFFFAYNTFHLLDYLEGDADHEVPIVMYSTPDEITPFFTGLTDSDHRDGKQGLIYIFHGRNTPSLYHFGETAPTIHEVGHYLGLNHPHDGYESQFDIAYYPVGSTYFLWLGDESATIMGYLLNTYHFGQFNQDTMDRYMTAAYVNTANSILGRIYASPRAGEATALIASGDQDATEALSAYSAMDYRTAASKAHNAYQKVLAAADQIGVKIEPEAWQGDYRANGNAGVGTLDTRQALRLNDPH